jgi:OFA family oxalate/formate antiporter-like MFS transporter
MTGLNMRRPDRDEQQEPAYPPIVAALLINFSMGFLYAWALFAPQFSGELELTQTAASVVPALSLMAFTVGVNICPALADRFSNTSLAILAFAGAIVGLSLAAALPSIYALIVGFSLIFGLAAGVGYCLAFRLANQAAPAIRSFAIGVCMTSFALTAIVLSLFASLTIAYIGARPTFTLTALILAAIGSTAIWLLRMTPDRRTGISFSRDTPDIYQSGLYIVAAAFFALCFAALAFLPNSTLILQDFRISPDTANKGVAIFNASYIVGSLCGARVAERMGGKLTATVVLTAQVGAIAAAVAYREPPVAWTLTAVLGCSLGSTASIFPIYLAGLVGAEGAAVLFPRLIILHGTAGLTSPVAFTFVHLHFGYSGSLPLLLVVTLLALTLQFKAPATQIEADQGNRGREQ